MYDFIYIFVFLCVLLNPLQTYPQKKHFDSPPCTDHCVVLNEIMADPYPTRGLPNCEYIELINRSGFEVQMKNWILHIGNKEYPIPLTILSPDDIVLVAKNGNGDSISGYGRVIEVGGLSIRNSGVMIGLAVNGLIVDEFYYTPSYHSPENKNGGCALERIDLNRTCGQQQNWSSSISVTGGTPGETNSVAGENTDNIIPDIHSVSVVSNNELLVVFTENIENECLKPGNFDFAGTLPVSDSIKYDSIVNELLFYFPENSIRNGESYKLWIDKLSDNCGNVNYGIEKEFSYYIPEYGDIFINEVLFNPRKGEAEFVEIYNNSNFDVDLSGMFLATRDKYLNLKSVSRVSNVELIFPQEEYFALTDNASSISNNYVVEDIERLIEMDKFPVLVNDGGRVVLLNKNMQLVDELIYSDNMHHRLITGTKGVSLERISIINDTNEPGNWHSASAGSGFGTPGYRNSSSDTDSIPDSGISVSPNIFSPNDDGYNDRLEIKISSGGTGWIANIRAYTPEGHMVCNLANNRLIAVNETIEWDGRDEHSQILGLGIYVLLIELFHPDGRKKHYRYPCAITDKLQ